jgi:membrane-associated phospholipid phosphatase
VVVLAIAAAGLTAAFLILAREVHGDSALSAFDQRITDAVVAWRTPGMNLLFWLLTLLGNALFLGTVTGAAVVVLIIWGARVWASLLAAGVIVAQIISSVMKYAYQRPRPPETIMLIETPISQSFPSGHALLTLVVSTLVLFLLLRYVRRCRIRSQGRSGGIGRFRPILIVLAFAAGFVIVMGVGFSRVYLGVHWASDVLAGWCLGGAWSAAVLAGFTCWERIRERGHGAWPDTCPQGSRKARVVFGVVMIAVAVAAYIVAGLADPLLV